MLERQGVPRRRRSPPGSGCSAPFRCTRKVSLLSALPYNLNAIPTRFDVLLSRPAHKCATATTGSIQVTTRQRRSLQISQDHGESYGCGRSGRVSFPCEAIIVGNQRNKIAKFCGLASGESEDAARRASEGDERR